MWVSMRRRAKNKSLCNSIYNCQAFCRNVPPKSVVIWNIMFPLKLKTVLLSIVQIFKYPMLDRGLRNNSISSHRKLICSLLSDNHNWRGLWQIGSGGQWSCEAHRSGWDKVPLHRLDGPGQLQQLYNLAWQNGGGLPIHLPGRGFCSISLSSPVWQEGKVRILFHFIF